MIIEKQLISEKYRKYIVKIITSDNKSLYILWGTDLLNEDFDYLLLVGHKYIASFLEINNLVKFCINNPMAIDPINTIKWAKEYKGNQPYCTYDLSSILNILNKSKKIDFNDLDKDEALLMVDFYNLFSDYIYQISDVSIIKSILKEKNMRYFVDTIYNNLFWNHIQSKRKISSFNKDLFITKYIEMIYIFEERLLLKG